MKKQYFLAPMVSFFLVLAACSNDSYENGTEDNDTAAPGTNQQETEETDNAASEEEELLDGALAALEGIDQRYEEATMSVEMPTGEEQDEELGEAENMETDSSTTIDVRSWQMDNEDGTVSMRMGMEGEGSPVEYIASGDSETSVIQYTEDDNTAYEVEMAEASVNTANIRIEEEQIRHLMDMYDVSYEGETTVNEYDAHHFVFTNGEEEVEYYFDTETFVIVRMVHSNDGVEILDFEVEDYALDFDYEEGFFWLEDVLGDEIDIEQVGPDELIDEQGDEDMEDNEV